ncbi:hypothetical protein Tcan_01104, partial [Toxocara canis]
MQAKSKRLCIPTHRACLDCDLLQPNSYAHIQHSGEEKYTITNPPASLPHPPDSIACLINRSTTPTRPGALLSQGRDNSTSRRKRRPSTQTRTAFQNSSALFIT